MEFPRPRFVEVMTRRRDGRPALTLFSTAYSLPPIKTSGDSYGPSALPTFPGEVDAVGTGLGGGSKHLRVFLGLLSGHHETELPPGPTSSDLPEECLVPGKDHSPVVPLSCQGFHFPTPFALSPKH